MTAIAPNTVIKFGTTYLPSDYTDTYHFDSLQDQLSYMNDNLVHVYTKFTYQREHRNFVKIEINSEQDADKWDYMMFQNTSYGNKWFFAFVTETEWINNLTVKIYYEIDYIQTYYFEYHELQCFIERTHTDTDNIGDNIIPENFETGEYIFNETGELLDLTSTHVIFIENGTNGRFIDGMYTGGKMYAFRCNNDNLSAIQTFLSQHTQSNSLSAAYFVPSVLLTQYTINDDHEITGYTRGLPYYASIPDISQNTYIDTYQPKNKKLLTYPYNFIFVTDNNSNNLILRYEFFNGTPEIMLKGTWTLPTFLEITPSPHKYKNGGGEAVYGRGLTFEKITLTGFPMMAWSYDAYNTWASRSLTPNIIKAIGAGVGGAIVGAVTGGTGAAIGAGVGSSAVSLVSNSLSEGYKASIDSDIAKGSFNNSTSPIATTYILHRARVSINRQYAKLIDDYFTMFGYAMKRIDIPSRKNRTRFTYVKTIGCIVTGNLPSGAKRKIEDCYNNGIRFWADYENYGSYENNQPLY